MTDRPTPEESAAASAARGDVKVGDVGWLPSGGTGDYVVESIEHVNGGGRIVFVWRPRGAGQGGDDTPKGDA